MASVTIQPPVLDLSIYAGDGVLFQLVCKDEQGAPIDITGTTQAQVRLDRSETSSPIVEITTLVTDSTTGIIEVSMTGEQTQQLSADPSSKNGKFSGVWDLEWTAVGAEPRTLCQGKVECVADVTR